MGTTKFTQRTFDQCMWGGPRPGSGPKCTKRSRVPHRSRARVSRHVPLHVTQRVRSDVPNLRTKAALFVLMKCFLAGCRAEGFRLVHYSIQRDHVHWILEADDNESFARGIGALKTRCARQLNALWGRRGPVFDGRSHVQPIPSPRQARHAIVYVLNNGRHHDAWYDPDVPDPFSSGLWCGDWDEGPVEVLGGIGCPVAEAETWLLRKGWRRHGPISVNEVPAANARNDS